MTIDAVPILPQSHGLASQHQLTTTSINIHYVAAAQAGHPRPPAAGLAQRPLGHHDPEGVLLCALHSTPKAN